MPGATPAPREVSEGANEPEAVLKCLGADIHLIAAEIDASVNFVLAPDQIEIVLERVDIGSTLKWRVAAITEGPIAALDLRGNQPLTVRAAGSRGTGGRAAQIGVGNSQLGRLASEIAQRGDVVEDAVVAHGGLVERLGENTWLQPTPMLRPWLMRFSLLPKALDSASPGAPPGTKENA